MSESTRIRRVIALIATYVVTLQALLLSRLSESLIEARKSRARRPLSDFPFLSLSQRLSARRDSRKRALHRQETKP
jgi:hypothetical protein